MTADATLDSLGIDSLDMVEFTCDIEERCEIEFEQPESIVTVVPLFPDELSPEQETAIDRLVASNSGTAGTPAGDRMAAWNRVVGGWRDRRR